MKTFNEIGLEKEFVSTLEKLKITIPSEIQEKIIPIVLSGKDVIGGSATGSGKTLAFSSGIIQNLKPNENIQTLILTPTRELAEQISTAIKNFSKYKKLNVVPIYGGVNIENQITKLRKADIVVGTPGRILDHLDRRTLNLTKIKFLVLDEVDRMFDMGFQIDVKKILDECPKKKQTMLFSATISPEVDYLAKKYTTNPEKVSVKSHVDPSKLKQVYYDIPDGMKFSLFVHLLKKEKANLVMVFCGTRRNVDFVTENLNNLGIKAKAIHGGMDQKKRNKVLEEFNSEYGVKVLVCTDVAARGLDIQGVSHVYNFDLPKTSEDYIHRIGRTARAGKDGIAISVLCSRDYENFGNILRDKNIHIKEEKAPYVERVQIIVNKKRNFRENKSFSRGRSSQGNSRGRRENNSRDSRRTKKPIRNSRDRKPQRGRRTNSQRNNNSRTRNRRR